MNRKNDRRKSEEPRHLFLFAALAVILSLGLIRLYSQKTPNQTESQLEDDSEDFTQADDNDPTDIEEASEEQVNMTSQASLAPPVSAPAPIALPAASAELYDFLNQLDPKAQWVLSKNQFQKISVISGGAIKLPFGEIKTKADLAARLAELTGTPAAQISKTENALPETNFSRTVQFQQVYEGYVVDQSFVRMTERKSDGAIFYSQFESHDLGEPDLRLKTNLAEAKAAALARYSQGADGILKTLTEPVIFVSAPQKSELAWVVIIKVIGPRYDERKLTISAVSGQVLQDVSALQN